MVVETEMFLHRELRRGVQPRTMCTLAKLRSYLRHTDSIVSRRVAGAVVECGVWRGGASFLVAKRLQTLGDARSVWMFDSFQGLPAPELRDGAAALAYAQDPTSPTYYNNCKADYDDARRFASEYGVGETVVLVKGWFSETLPAAAAQIGSIAILRIDADWYEGVSFCLATLYDAVTQGGVVIIDDYYEYEGCALAVHDFLADRQLPFPIMQDGCAFFVKT